MENEKQMQPIEDRNKSARQMEREGGERESARQEYEMAGKAITRNEMNRDAMKKASGRKMKR
jgi:hypothetical protein